MGSIAHQRIAIVTGASSGIGEATARKFFSMGFGVIGNGRNGKKLTALEQELGGWFYGLAGDATDPNILENLFSAAHERFGRPADIVVANAGRGLGGSVLTADLTQFEELLAINVTGTLTLLQKAGQRMLEEKEEADLQTSKDIVIVGSVVGRHISPFSAVYSSSKFAVHSLAEGLRREIGPKGVRVSLVEPGMVISGFQAGAGYSEDMVQALTERFGPLPTCDDVANAIHYIVEQPPHVHISDIVVRPTRQDYP